jgi:molybdate transport system permease protein
MLSPAELEALRVSLVVAFTAVAISLPAGILVGWLLARRQFFGKTAVETLINLPLVMPPVVTGYLLLVLFGRHGWLGGLLDRWLGIRFVFDWKGAALAAAVVSFPLMVRSIRLAFSAVDVRLEQAARTLGAGRLDAFLSVSLPLARNGVIAGCVLAFARSLGEFGATVMIAGNIAGRTRTMPLFIYNELETPGGLERSMGLVIVSIAVAAGALVLGEILERRGRRRLGSV